MTISRSLGSAVKILAMRTSDGDRREEQCGIERGCGYVEFGDTKVCFRRGCRADGRFSAYCKSSIINAYLAVPARKLRSSLPVVGHAGTVL